MYPLKLPEFDIKEKKGDVFCLIRKKWVSLTPEEWVRQHFINLLVAHLHYPRGMMKLEQSLKYFQNNKRSDIVVLGKDASTFMVVECKAANVPINQKVLNQVTQYNKILKAKYMVVTNGLQHFTWKNQVQVKDFPRYEQQ